MGNLDFNNLPDSVKNIIPIDYTIDDTPPETNNYLANNKFVFLLRRCPTLTYFCQRANIPAISFGISAQSNPTGIAPIKRPGTQYTLDDMSIGFMVDENMKNWLEIYNWMKSLGIYDSKYEILKEKDKVSDAILLILNSASNPILSVSFYNIFPISLSGIDFDASLPDTDPVLSMVTFAYTHYLINPV